MATKQDLVEISGMYAREVIKTRRSERTINALLVEKRQLRAELESLKAEFAKVVKERDELLGEKTALAMVEAANRP